MGLLDRLIRKQDPTPAGQASTSASSDTSARNAPPDSRESGERRDQRGDGGQASGSGRRRRRRGGRRRSGGARSEGDRTADRGPADTVPTDNAPSDAAVARRDQPRSQADDRESADAPAEERGGRRRRGRRRGRGADGDPETRREGETSSPPRSDRSSAAARRALASGGYQLPPLSAVDQIDPEHYPAAFRDLGLSDRALSVMAALGFEGPTPIQEQTVPVMLDGHDVVGQAQTGTGKTLAFGLLIVERLDPDQPDVQAVVLVPTRELAQQVFGVLEFLAEAMHLRAAPLVGGRRLTQDFDNLERRPQIVVGTPGRIIDHLERRTLDLSAVRVAVLDEADRMLDIGFEPDMRRILRRCPDDRQTALFSATIPTPIKTLIWRYMHEPTHIQTEPEQAAPREINQRYYEVAEQDKLKALSELLPEMQGRTLIFCNMKVTVDRLVRRLRDRDILAEAIHGDLDQRKRDRVMERFRAGELQFLVATNVASRGLDIPDLNHVVNFDLPQNADEYVHRVGRTGRAGREGSAVTFVSEWDYESFDAIKKLAGDDLSHADLDLYARSR